MARPSNIQESVVIRITTTPVVKRYLQQLVDTGTWGKNVADAAERVVSMSLSDMVDNGKLRKPEV
jgi:hypothetical protein